MRSNRIPGTPALVVTVVAGLIFVLPSRQAAHEVPSDVTVQAYVKPEGQQLRLLVRVPLEAMQDIPFPTSGPGYLDLAGAEHLLPDAAMLWLGQEVELYEEGNRLAEPKITAIRLSLPSDRSFTSYKLALTHVTTGPRLPNSTRIIWRQTMLDVLFDYPIQSERSHFSIHPGLERLGMRVTIALRFLTPDGTERAFELRGDPGLVTLDPWWYQAALRFVESGFFHILDGTDHLLFLVCLVVPFRRFRALVPTVTGFTVAHSITLIASAYGLAPAALWFPPLVETLIAVSILYMAFENIIGTGVGRRWLIAFGFGLVHGFGFSFALRETMQFAGSHLLTALLSFNVGVELGQLLVIALLVPALEILFRFVVTERIGAIFVSALVAHTSWHWTSERYEILSQHPITWSALGATLLVGIMPWVIAMLMGAIMVRLGLRRLRRHSEATAADTATATTTED